MHAARLVTASAADAVSLDDIKAEAGVLHVDDDARLARYVDSAIAHLDGPRGVLGRCLINQVWAQDFDAWGNPLRLPVPDVSAATVSYIDADGATQVVAPELIAIDNRDAWAEVRFVEAFVFPVIGADARGVTVEFTAGFGPAASDVPAPIKSAILIHARCLYDDRPLGPHHDALIAPFRRGLA